MINNFEQIKSLMDFPNDGDFYYTQILMRRKDDNEDRLDRNVRLIKSYYISSIEQLDELTDEIIGLCDYFNARAYVNLNRRNYEKCSLQTARLILDQLANKDHKSAKKAFNTVCGRYHSDSDKKWLIDVDEPLSENNSLLEDILYAISQIRPEGDKHIATIPTKNGFHLIIRPFALNEFNTKMHEMGYNWNNELDIHKNNPTVLYIK